MTSNQSNISVNENQTSNYTYQEDQGSSSWIEASLVGAVPGFLGIITNILSIIVFSQANMRKNRFNAYLLAKSASELYLCLEYCIEPLYFCPYCFGNYIYWFQIVEWITDFFLSYVALLTSIMLEVMATFERYSVITKKFEFYQRIDHRLIILVIYSSCALFFAYSFFAFEIISYTDDVTNSTAYYVGLSEFGIGSGKVIFRLPHIIIRDFICVFLIVVLNILILIQMRRAMTKKKAMTGAHNQGSKAKAEQAEKKITIMVILTGVLTVCAHVPQILIFIRIPGLDPVISSQMFWEISSVIYIGGFAINFFIYLIFNNNFQQAFFDLFGKLKCKCLCKQSSPNTKPNTSVSRVSTSKKSASVFKSTGQTVV